MTRGDLRERALEAWAEHHHRQQLCDMFAEMLIRDLGVTRWESPFRNRPIAIVAPGIHLCLVGDTLPNVAMRAPGLALYKPCGVCGRPVGVWPLPPYDLYSPLASIGMALEHLNNGGELDWSAANHREEEHGDADRAKSQEGG